MSTNITAQHKAAFDHMQISDPGYALFSCFVNGEPASAICYVRQDADGYVMVPLFVSLTPAMVLTDHDGRLPEEE